MMNVYHINLLEKNNIYQKLNKAIHTDYKNYIQSYRVILKSLENIDFFIYIKKKMFINIDAL